MLYRYAEKKGYDLTVSNAWEAFGDADKVSEFAREGMAWAVNQGIISGKEDTGTLEPVQNIARAEMATMLIAFLWKNFKLILPVVYKYKNCYNTL